MRVQLVTNISMDCESANHRRWRVVKGTGGKVSWVLEDILWVSVIQAPGNPQCLTTSMAVQRK
jgi:hypothetical protein